MDFLPINIRVSNRKIVIIGGGKVAAQKLQVLTRTSANIYVYANAVCEEIKSMDLTWEELPYDPSQLTDAFLVFACTDAKDVNRRIAGDAQKSGITVNVADDPQACGFTSPAIWFNDSMCVAVSSDGKNARRSVDWRNAIREWGEHDPTLR